MRTRVIVLIVEREIVDPRPCERKIAWRKLRDYLCEFAIDGVFAEAADEDGDLTHDGTPLRRREFTALYAPARAHRRKNSRMKYLIT
jgi:hypothetical protein